MACSGARTHFKSIYIIPDLKSRYIVITPEQAAACELVANFICATSSHNQRNNGSLLLMVSVHKIRYFC
jgi:hypothetical protein